MNRRSVKIVKEAMVSEIERSMSKLRSPGHPKPYFISYLARDHQSYNVWGRYGSVATERRDHKRNCYTDLRVGSYKYDQITEGGLEDNSEDAESFELIDLPCDNNLDATRFCLWRLTDAKYREAVKAYHGRKARDVSYLDENKGLGSFRVASSSISESKIRAFNIDQKHYRVLVKKLSLLFKAELDVKNSYVEFQADLETKVFVSSEGVQRVWQVPTFQLNIYFWYLTKKYNQDFSLNFVLADLGELPDYRALKREIIAKIDLAKKISKGSVMTSYAGPVLLAPKPAGLFIHEVLGHRLEGSRLLADSEGKTFKDKLGAKVMNSELSVIDDPTLKKVSGSSLVGHYPYDDEGSLAKAVTLIENGVLKNFLSTRSPLKQQKDCFSNGHARSQNFERPISRMANLIVRAQSGLSWPNLKQKLINEVVDKGLPFGVVLYEVEGGETGTEAYDFQAFLGEITVATKIFADGREEYIRGVDFVGTPLASLNTIIAAGNVLELDNGYCGAESGTIPVSTLSPSLLLRNLELQSKDSTKVTQYRLPLPWVDDG